jgi:hypothetical protein
VVAPHRAAPGLLYRKASPAALVIMISGPMLAPADRARAGLVDAFLSTSHAGTAAAFAIRDTRRAAVRMRVQPEKPKSGQQPPSCAGAAAIADDAVARNAEPASATPRCVSKAGADTACQSMLSASNCRGGGGGGGCDGGGRSDGDSGGATGASSGHTSGESSGSEDCA